MFCSAGDLPQEASTVCRYHMAGNCRRGSSCRFVHPPLMSVQQEYPYTEGLDIQPGTQSKGWHQGIIQGFTAFPIYTTTQHTGRQGFNASRDVSDNFSDVSSSNDSIAASDQGLTTTFKVLAIKETVPSEPFPFYQSEFSQYPNNTDTPYGNVAYPGYHRRDNARGTSCKSNPTKKKHIAYKTKPCKFFSASKTCTQGDKCTFIHDAEKVRWPKTASSEDCETKPSHLPSKPHSLLEDFKARNFYPITWRVIGGGVMMGPPCKAFAAGYCPDGADCKLAHETKLQTSDASHNESEHKGLSTEYPGLASVVYDTYGGISSDTRAFSSGCEDEEEPSSAGKRSSAKNGIPLQHRRARSMSLPSSPSVFRAPHIFAEL